MGFVEIISELKMRDATMEAMRAAQIAKLKLATAAKETLERSPSATMCAGTRSRRKRKTAMLASTQAALIAKLPLAIDASAVTVQAHFAN